MTDQPSTRGRRGRPPSREVQRGILDQTEKLLAKRRFDEISVEDIIKAAGVSRASFYFYFESKYAVLAELLREAVGQGMQAAEPWLEREQATVSPLETVRQGITDGAHLWKARAPVLRAIVENWQADPGLRTLWTELMGQFTQETMRRIQQDREQGVAPPIELDLEVLSSTLTWLGERIYYLAAIGLPPFDKEENVIDALTEIWWSTVYQAGSGMKPSKN